MSLDRKRTIWVDNAKTLAIIAVVIGHLYQSMVKSELLPNNTFYSTFDSLIYTFHVPLLFICSGYLYQKYTKITGLRDYGYNISKKFISYSIPYVAFVTIMVFLKTIFSSSVNDESKGLIHSLIIAPIAPYWFLFALFLIFCVVPTAKSSKGAVAITGVFTLIYAITVIFQVSLPNFVDQVISGAMYFSFGISIAYFGIDEKIGKIYTGLLFILFLAIGIPLNVYQISFALDKLLLSVIACLGIIGFLSAAYSLNKQTRVLGFLSKYTFSIYLMHTIFAAGIRGLLLKIGIDNSVLHIIAGFIFSFAGPIIAYEIMKKIKLDFFIYPTKYIKLKRKAEVK